MSTLPAPSKPASATRKRPSGRATPCAPPAANRPAPLRRAGGRPAARSPRDLPTPLERDTLLTPLWVAESVVQEVERFLQAGLPVDFAERLARRAQYLYPRHAHFRQGLNRPGNRGRENLRMFMRHWTAGWLRRDKSPHFKKLPPAFANGQPLPA